MAFFDAGAIPDTLSRSPCKAQRHAIFHRLLLHSYIKYENHRPPLPPLFCAQYATGPISGRTLPPAPSTRTWNNLFYQLGWQEDASAYFDERWFELFHSHADFSGLNVPFNSPSLNQIRSFIRIGAYFTAFTIMTEDYWHGPSSRSPWWAGSIRS